MNSIDLYDDVYAWKDYKHEVDIFCSTLNDLGIQSGSILELACGTGAYLRHFTGWDRTGVDLCSFSIDRAQAEQKDVSFLCADMKETGITRLFDVVLCVFGGVSYLPREDIHHALAHWKSLLKPGGFLIIEPWIEEENIQFGKPFLFEFSSADYSFSRVVTPKKVDNSCVLNFFFLVIDHALRVHRFQQKDTLFLNKEAWWKARFQEHGLSIFVEREGFLKGSTVWYLRNDF